jgi:SAM-dependent methyltransferase
MAQGGGRLDSLYNAVGRQLAEPRGVMGRLTGALMRFINRAPNRLAIDALALLADDVVLELGFGPGEALALIDRAVPYGKVHGIDRSATMLAQATERNQQSVDTGRITLRTGDFSQLPYPDACFSKVLAVNVAYFWKDPAAMAQEIRRILRPGGCLAIYATDEATMRSWRFASAETHRHVDERGILDALVQGGFDDQRIRCIRSRLPGGIVGLTIAASLPTLDEPAAAEVSDAGSTIPSIVPSG